MPEPTNTPSLESWRDLLRAMRAQAEMGVPDDVQRLIDQMFKLGLGADEILGTADRAARAIAGDGIDVSRALHGIRAYLAVRSVR